MFENKDIDVISQISYTLTEEEKKMISSFQEFYDNINERFGELTGEDLQDTELVHDILDVLMYGGRIKNVTFRLADNDSPWYMPKR